LIAQVGSHLHKKLIIMKLPLMKGAALTLLALGGVDGRNDDLFNYDLNNRDGEGVQDFGQQNWIQTTCSDPSTCVSVNGC
jgi:hypothetical protein